MNIVRSAIILRTATELTSKISSRNYAFKTDLKIKWVHPGKVSCIKPEKSGDMEPMPKIDKSQLQPMFRDCKELEGANDLVRKLFTLEFAPRNQTTKLYIHNIKHNVQRHTNDMGSIEAKIARWTGWIRATQEVMENFPRNKRLKVRLKELIDKRKKHLKYLRRWDYKRFEWLIDSLNIVYKPPPNEFHWITRKGSLVKLTDKYCDDIRNDRLESYKLKLLSEQPAFLKEKIRTLEFIRQEQQDCGVQVTVSQEQIDNVKKQLADMQKERAEKDAKKDEDD